jgi:CheY-like chemotaxis protein
MTPKCEKNYRVLVVDDDPSVLATYRRLLRRQGYETLAQDDPQRVLTNGFDPGSIDLLLLDYKMPGMDGLSLLAELRRRECRARCILLSAFLNDDVRSQASNLGVDRVLEKPVGVRELRRALDELLPLPPKDAQPAEEADPDSSSNKARVVAAS